MDTIIESYIGKDTLSPTNLTYATYTVLIATSLIAILLLRSITSALFSSKKTKGTKHVLLVGPEKTGKTVLTNVLITGTKPHHDTVTSMTPTQRSSLVNGNRLTLTDFPGSSQARNCSLDEQLAAAAGVVFVIDGRFGSMTDEARASAALMKRVLINGTFRGRKIPILVAFNKMDLITDTVQIGDTLKSSEWLRKHKDLLQRELDGIKEEMLTSTGASSGASYQLGTEQAFEFEMDVESTVSFCCCTTETGREGVQDVLNFCTACL